MKNFKRVHLTVESLRDALLKLKQKGAQPIRPTRVYADPKGNRWKDLCK